MYNIKYVFAQLVTFLNQSKFNRIVAKYDGEKYVKHFTCWNQLLAMMFGQLCNRASLRDLITILKAHGSKCYHLRLGKISPKLIWHRPIIIETPVFLSSSRTIWLPRHWKSARPESLILEGAWCVRLHNHRLMSGVFWWAKFRKSKGGIKVHTIYDIETQIPASFHITTASVNDIKAMDVIPYEQGSY